MVTIRKMWIYCPANFVLGLCITILFLSTVIWSQGQNFPGGGTPGASSSSAAFTIYPTVSGCGAYSRTGTSICASNNVTGATISGTDLRPIWDMITAAYPQGGHFFFKLGTYNCNSLDQESTGGFSNFYCMGFPSGGSTQYSQWIIEGESAPPLLDQFDSTPAQTNGSLINLTTTAISSVAANSKIMILWTRPDVVNAAGPQMFLKNLGVRVPINTRGCETQVDFTQALSVDYDNVAADTAVAESSLVFPVQAACVAWGGTDPGGLIGLTTTSGAKQENWFRRTFSEGADVGFDIRAEHTEMESSFAARCNHAIDYGVRPAGVAINHSSYWLASGWGECARGLTLGPNLNLGSALNLTSLDFEDATVSIAPLFQVVYHVLETNAGFTNGIISFSDTTAGVGNVGVANLFDGGGGGSFSVLQATSQHNIARTPGVDSFTRANSTSVGPAWLPNLSCKLQSNSAQISTPGSAGCLEIYFGQQFVNDQNSAIKVATLDVNASSIAFAYTNMTLNGSNQQSGYEYYCSAASATGSGIAKVTNGTGIALGDAQTSVAGCVAGDTIELRHIGTWLYAYRNGLLDKNIPTNPISDATYSTGNPGFAFSEDATGLVSMQNWSGGSPPLATPTNSTFNYASYATSFNTIVNCAVNSVSPAACGSAASGAFVIPTTTAAYTVNTSAVTTHSRILLQPITFAADLPSAPTCVVPLLTTDYSVSAISAGVSFSMALTSTTGQTCWQYWVVN